MRLKIILVVLCAFIGKSYGQLRCYACGFTSNDPDKSCETITNSTQSVECSYEYCTILRQEFIDPPGVISSFLRGCDDQPDFLNHDVVDQFFRTYYRSCTSDLCNTGDGIQSIVGGNLNPYPQYEGDNLLVPGTGSGVNALRTSLLVLLIAVILHYI